MSRTSNALMLLTGLAAGAALALLFAPKTGKETRADLLKKGEDLYDRLAHAAKKGKAMVDEATELARDVADTARQGAASAQQRAHSSKA